MKIGLIFFSSGDITRNLILAAAKAIEENSVDVYTYEVTGKDIIEGRFKNQDVFAELQNCDGIIFGSPTYMGSVAAQLKAFIDASSSLWSKQEWAGKVAAGITCGSALNGDQSSTLQYLVTFASQHGMYWVSLDAAHTYNDHGVNRLGCQLGVVAQSTSNEANETDLATASYLGDRMAKLVKKLCGNV